MREIKYKDTTIGSFCDNLHENDNQIKNNIPEPLRIEFINSDNKGDSELLEFLYKYNSLLAKPIIEAPVGNNNNTYGKLSDFRGYVDKFVKVSDDLSAFKLLNDLSSAISSLNKKIYISDSLRKLLEENINELGIELVKLELKSDTIDKSKLKKIKKEIKELLGITKGEPNNFFNNLQVSIKLDSFNNENYILLIPSKKANIKRIELNIVPEYLVAIGKITNKIKDELNILSQEPLLVPAVYSPVFFDITKFLNIKNLNPVNIRDENRDMDIYRVDRNNILYMLKGHKFSLLTEKLIMKICINYNERNEIDLDIIEFMKELDRVITNRNKRKFKEQLRREIFSLSKCSLCLEKYDYDSILNPKFSTKGDIWRVKLSDTVFNSLKGGYKKELFSQYHKNLFKINTHIAYEIGKKLVYYWNLNRIKPSRAFKTNLKGIRSYSISVNKLLEGIIDLSPERILIKENGENYKKKDIGTFIITPLKEALDNLKINGIINNYELSEGDNKSKLEGNINYSVNEAPDLIIVQDNDFIDIEFSN